jgi:hypothetical protein
MAEYVKFRMRTAKVGVSMALLAFIAGVAEKAQANPQPTATASAGGLNFLKLTGLSKAISGNLLKIEAKIVKIDSAVASLERKEAKMERTLNGFYKPQKIDATFLKITDANNTFLKNTATAADSQKLGGIPAGQYFQGRGNVMTNAVSITDGTTQPGLQGAKPMMGDGSVKVLIGLSPSVGGPGPEPAVFLQNTQTTGSINFTVNGGKNADPNGGSSIGPGQTVTLIPAVQDQGQLDVQLFGGGGGAGKVWTLTVSDVGGAGGHSFVGQLLIGLL